MKSIFLLSLLTTCLLNGFAQQPLRSLEKHAQTFRSKMVKDTLPRIKTPDVLWGQLFKDVQLTMALGDNKSFTDAVPKFDRKTVLKKYADAGLAGSHDSAAIRAFVMENFKVPVPYNATGALRKDSSLKRHLEELWPTLVRKSDVRESNSSLLPLPKAYIVPGGRFREIYYWDSYFTMLGLDVSHRQDLISNMLDNFKYLIDTYGHIPNGNRSYYLGRSQPPYFALMVDLLHQSGGDQVYRKYYTAMLREYNWWMDGSEKASTGHPYRRVVKLKDGSILNRYFDDVKAPRQESYVQDVETAKHYKGTDNLAFTHLRAGAESGWDFSSRWFADTASINTIETADITPVDLNCLLYAYENILSKAAKANGLKAVATSFAQQAEKRKQAILAHCWNQDNQYFFDYNFRQEHTTNRWSLAGVMPLFTQIATVGQAAAVRDHIENKFLKDGGVVTTVYHTGQQWDAPNGWAPLQYLTVKGLQLYGHNAPARDIATKWMSINETVYANTGKMLEKYNVENIHLPSGGGEYPTQDGFGWSNGVYLKFYSMYRR